MNLLTYHLTRSPHPYSAILHYYRFYTYLLALWIAHCLIVKYVCKLLCSDWQIYFILILLYLSVVSSRHNFIFVFIYPIFVTLHLPGPYIRYPSPSRTVYALPFTFWDSISRCPSPSGTSDSLPFTFWDRNFVTFHLLGPYIRYPSPSETPDSLPFTFWDRKFVTFHLLGPDIRYLSPSGTVNSLPFTFWDRIFVTLHLLGPYFLYSLPFTFWDRIFVTLHRLGPYIHLMHVTNEILIFH